MIILKTAETLTVSRKGLLTYIVFTEDDDEKMYLKIIKYVSKTAKKRKGSHTHHKIPFDKIFECLFKYRYLMCSKDFSDVFPPDTDSNNYAFLAAALRNEGLLIASGDLHIIQHNIISDWEAKTLALPRLTS